MRFFLLCFLFAIHEDDAHAQWEFLEWGEVDVWGDSVDTDYTFRSEWVKAENSKTAPSIRIVVFSEKEKARDCVVRLEAKERDVGYTFRSGMIHPLDFDEDRQIMVYVKYDERKSTIRGILDQRYLRWRMFLLTKKDGKVRIGGGYIFEKGLTLGQFQSATYLLSRSKEVSIMLPYRNELGVRLIYVFDTEDLEGEVDEWCRFERRK